MLKKLLLLLSLLAIPAFADTTAEINHLINYVKTTECKYIRNGTVHTGSEGAKHIKAKYDHYKDDIKTIKCGAILREVDKSASPKLQKRISIAEYIKRTWTKGAIELLIVDEMHECATC